MARCVSLQGLSSCALSQSIQPFETPDSCTGSATLCQLVNSHLKLQSVGFSVPENTRRRTSHVTNATRPTRRRQIRKTEETVVVEDDPPENWKNSDYDDGLPRPWLDEQDFFEGEQWNYLGTFVEWMPVIGVVFAVRTFPCHGFSFHCCEIAEN
jgi:hypothetical protein